jgi:hypothetical protein
MFIRCGTLASIVVFLPFVRGTHEEHINLVVERRLTASSAISSKSHAPGTGDRDASTGARGVAVFDQQLAASATRRNQRQQVSRQLIGP